MEKLKYVFDGIETVYIHKQKIQVMAREDKKTLKNHALFNSVIRDIGQFFEGEDFSANELNESYVKLVVKSMCDYNPFEKAEYYDREETREQEPVNQNQMH